MRLLLLLAILCSAACAAKDVALTPQEEAVALAVGVDKALAARLKSQGESIERLKGLSADFEETQADGIVVLTAPNDGADVLAEIRERLSGTPYRAYLHDNAFGHGPDKIAVIKGDDYAYLGIVRTDGINYDLDHDDVMARYRLWDQKYGLRLVGAGGDWIEAEFVRPPEDWQAFAKELHAFCPDIVEQGVGDVDALAGELQETGRLYLWWD